MLNYKKIIISALSLSLLGLAPLASADAPIKRSACVFDIAGASGDMYNLMKDYKTMAMGQGVDLSLKPYTDEKIAGEDFKAGVCDAVMMTGIRARNFNLYSGTLAAVGAIPDYQTLKVVLKVLSSGNKKINERLTTGPNEVAGIVPMGAAYLFVNDRSMNNINALSGKKISVMGYDPHEAMMAKIAGMSPVKSDITNFAGRFNNGSVDVCFAPIAAYDALELYKGLSPDGGIVRFVLGQLVAEVLIKTDRFPAGFGQTSREWMFGQFDRAMKIIKNAEDAVDPKWWIDISDEDKKGYNELFRKSRIIIRDKGVYDADMTHLLFKIRCSIDGSRGECSSDKE